MKKRIVIALLALSLPRFAAVAGDSTAAPTLSATTPAWNLYTALTNAGFTFPITYTGEILGNPVGGYRQGAIYDGLLEAGMQADLSKLANWPGGTFTADFYYPHGSSLTRNDVHDLNVVSNIDSLHYPRLYELWLEQDLMNGKFSIRFGQIAADTDFFQTAYGALFMNSAFGAIPTIAMNMNAPIYPVAIPGVRVRINPNENWSFLAGVFDGNTGDLRTSDRYGTNFNFDSRNGALCLAEIDYMLNPPAAASSDGKSAAPTSRPLAGTYKLGGFLNTGDFTDIRSGGTLHGDYGFYALADQELWHQPGAPDQGLRGFCRCGFAPADRNQIDFDGECGVNYAGVMPQRPKDLMGLGFAYTKVSNGVLDDAGTAPARHYESILELTYQAPINDHVSLQPDVQYVFNPSGGAEPLSNALVLGLRFVMTF